jgi:hypothetical protein
MDFEADREITRELNSGERLIWTGRPGQGLIFRPRDVIPGVFGIVWTAFVLAGLVSSVRSNKYAPPIGILALFLAIGFYLVAGRFLVDALRRAKTSYGVTNERVLIISGIFQRTVKSLNLRTLSDITLRERRDQRGSISFGGSAEWLWFMSGIDVWVPGAGDSKSFEYIRNAKQVYEQIRGAQRAAA